MWFKNLNIYQFKTTPDFSSDVLESKLADMCFIPCQKSAAESTGWAAPIGTGDEAPLVHAANGILLFCLKSEEKILPSSVIREKLSEKVEAIELREARKVKRKEKEKLKDEIYFSLLPLAFTKTSTIYGYIDTQKNLLVVDSASTNKSEDFVSFLRKTLGSLKVVIPEVQSPSLIMTDWVKNNTNPAFFQLENSGILQNPQDEKSLLRCQKQDLLSSKIQAFIHDGFDVIQMALSWSEQLTFTLKHDFTLRQVTYLDAVKDIANDIFTETPEQRFDADFAIMTETLRNFLSDLFSVFEKQNAKLSQLSSEA